MVKKESEFISFPLRLTEEVERLFDEMIHRPWGFCREIRGWNPSVDLFETTDALVLEADLPGVKAENVKVEVKDGELVLQGWHSRRATATANTTLWSEAAVILLAA
jgi:HSP20 family molecular chaperone IbpA